MTPLLISILMSTLACLMMAGLSALKIRDWKERGFDARPIRWGLLILISTVFGVAVGTLSFLGSENALTSTTVAVGGYLTVLASTVDVLLLRIPSEPTKTASVIGAVLFIIALPTLIAENYMSLLFWGLVIAVFGVCSLLGYLGDADMRIFVSFFFLFAWWIPPTELTVALLLMSVFGLFTRVLSSAFNIGVDKALHEKTRWNPETQKMEPVSAPSVDESEARKHKRKAQRTHKFFPFGPAILVSFLGVSVFASFNSIIAPTFTL